MKFWVIYKLRGTKPLGMFRTKREAEDAVLSLDFSGRYEFRREEWVLAQPAGEGA